MIQLYIFTEKAHVGMMGSIMTSRIALAILLSTVAVFYTGFGEIFQTPKFFLLTGSTLILLCILAVRIVFVNRIPIPRIGLWTGFLALAVSSLITTVFSGSNISDQLNDPVASPWVFFSLALLSHFLQTASTRGATTLRYTYIILVSILSILSIYMYFGLGEIMFPASDILKDKLFTPVGNPYVLFALLVMAIPAILFSIQNAYRHTRDIDVGLYTIAGLLVLTGTAFLGIQLAQTASTSLLPLSSAWSILMESYKTFKNALVGVGLDNYISAFNAGRPAQLNTTPIWNLRFTSGPSLFFHIGATQGLVGIFAFSVFLINIVKSVKNNPAWYRFSTIFLAVLSLFIIQPHLALWTGLIFILLPLTKNSNSNHDAYLIIHQRWVAWVTASATILGCAILFIFWWRSLMGEIVFGQSLSAASNNDGKKTYEKQIQAIGYKPDKTAFHIAYSQTNISLANSIASQAENNLNTLTEEDKTLFSQLIQQAVREAKTATTLSPRNVLAWENQAKTYQAIAGVVTGSDQWAIASYQEAIKLDPTNPLLRMDLSGLFMRLGKFDEAIQELKTASYLKNDLANIHYNLAYAYGQTKAYYNQAVELKRTAALIDPSSEDAKKVEDTLKEVVIELNEQEKTSFSEIVTGIPAIDQIPLSTPKPEPVFEIEPKLDILPEEATTSSLPHPSPESTGGDETVEN